MKLFSYQLTPLPRARYGPHYGVVVARTQNRLADKANESLRKGVEMASEGNGIIGKAITIRGNLTGDGDLLVEGQVEGQVSLKNHLTIESTGKIDAEIRTGVLTIHGEANGQIEVDELVSLHSSAIVTGDIKAPKVIIEDGARFNGSIEMEIELPEDLASEV